MPQEKTTAPLRVGYVLKMFPRLSETFILNELLEFERQAGELSVFSLMYPNDGSFHGRLGELRTTAEYFRAGKLEATWNAVREIPTADVPPMERLASALAFLQQHAIPRDLDVLLRAVLIASRAKQRGVQHLHAHFATSATHMAAVVSMLSGIPFSFTAHAKDIFSQSVDRDLFVDLVRRAAFTVTVSDYNRRFILEHMPEVPAEKIIRLYNGIDMEFFRPDGDRGTPSALDIVSVGRLVPKKGFDHLLRALRACKDDGLEFRATVVGDGPELGSLLALREQLGLSAEVGFPGSMPQEHVRQLCSSAGMIALACVPDDEGDMDALPTVLLEALALDLPIVSTRLTGVPEIVGEDAGLLVEPGDDAAFAAAIRTLWERIRSGKQPPGLARARGERLFDLRANAATLRGLFARSAAGEAIV